MLPAFVLLTLEKTKSTISAYVPFRMSSYLSDAIGSTDKLLVVENTLAGQEDENGIDHGQGIDGLDIALIDGQQDVPHENKEQS